MRPAFVDQYVGRRCLTPSPIIAASLILVLLTHILLLSCLISGGLLHGNIDLGVELQLLQFKIDELIICKCVDCRLCAGILSPQNSKNVCCLLEQGNWFGWYKGAACTSQLGLVNTWHDKLHRGGGAESNTGVRSPFDKCRRLLFITLQSAIEIHSWLAQSDWEKKTGDRRNTHRLCHYSQIGQRTSLQ